MNVRILTCDSPPAIEAFTGLPPFISLEGGNPFLPQEIVEEDNVFALEDDDLSDLSDFGIETDGSGDF